MRGRRHLRRGCGHGSSGLSLGGLVGPVLFVRRAEVGQPCARALLARNGTCEFAWFGSLCGGESSSVPSSVRVLWLLLGLSCRG